MCIIINFDRDLAAAAAPTIPAVQCECLRALPANKIHLNCSL